MQTTTGALTGLLNFQQLGLSVRNKTVRRVTMKHQQERDMKQSEALRLVNNRHNAHMLTWQANACAELRKLSEANKVMLEALKDLEQTAGIALLHNDPVRFRARAAINKGEEQ